jgi:hypothetical protein
MAASPSWEGDVGLTAILIAAVKDLLLPKLEEQIAEAGAPTLITRADMDKRLADTGAYERMANRVALETHQMPPDAPAAGQ